MPFSSGTRLGPYEVLELVGTGGMGEVYKARDTRLRRTVALKTIGGQLEADPAARNRLVHEARAVAALNHPHICALHDVGESNGQDFLVMEFLEGQTLQERLARGSLPANEWLDIAIQIASALAAAHRAGIVHRDLKPSNVMLTRSGVKLLDFGIARQHAPAGAVAADTATASLMSQQLEYAGTLPYMSPEQLEGRAVDPRTDIFAFGAVLYEMATGRRAFAGGSPAAVIASVLADARPRAAAAQPTVPRALDRLITSCLARDPEERPQHAADLLRELTWIREDQANPAAPESHVTRGPGWAVHAAWLAALVAVATIAWTTAARNGEKPPAANPTPVVVLMDSPLSGRVYDPRTAAAGGTNADDISDALRDMPLIIHKEATNPLWHREEQVVAQNPDLVITHLSCLFDARVVAKDTSASEHLFSQAENRLLLVLAYTAARNPRTRFIVYSRTVFQTAGGEAQWVAQQESRLPVLKGRLRAFIVPGGTERATFRDAETAKLLRARVLEVLGRGGR